MTYGKGGWKIVDLVYDVTLTFPNTEKFGLQSQMQRAAVSIPTNISEGFMRKSKNEYRHFCTISLGSCGELDTLSIISQKRGYMDQETKDKLEKMLMHEGKMLNNLVRCLK